MSLPNNQLCLPATTKSTKINVSSSPNINILEMRTIHPPIMKPKIERKKRIRFNYTNDMILALEKQYKRTKYVKIKRRDAIAAEFGLNPHRVKIWFQNRRMKEKAENGRENVTGLRFRRKPFSSASRSSYDSTPSPVQCNEPVQHQNTGCVPNENASRASVIVKTPTIKTKPLNRQMPVSPYQTGRDHQTMHQHPNSENSAFYMNVIQSFQFPEIPNYEHVYSPHYAANTFQSNQMMSHFSPPIYYTRPENYAPYANPTHGNMFNPTHRINEQSQYYEAITPPPYQFEPLRVAENSTKHSSMSTTSDQVGSLRNSNISNEYCFEENYVDDTAQLIADNDILENAFTNSYYGTTNTIDYSK